MPTTLVTGGHGGIGLECCKTLASQYHSHLILAGRSVAQMQAVAAELRATYRIIVHVVTLDTSSLSSVRTAAAQCAALLDNGEVDSLQAIVCNAGVRMNGYAQSVDGYEQTFATNFLGHFLLVELLLPRLTSAGRVVFTVSGTHDPDTTDGKLVGAAAEPDAMRLAKLGSDGTKPLSTGQLYSTSKLCMVMYAYELDRRLRRSGSTIASIAFDPGTVSGTDFLRDMPAPVQWLANSRVMPWLSRRLGVTIGSLAFSGAALAKVTADPAYANGSGKYFQASDGHLIERQSSKISYDQARTLKLWTDATTLTQ